MDAVQLRRFCIAGRRKYDRRAFYAAAAVKIQRSCRSMEDDVNIQKNQIFTVKITERASDIWRIPMPFQAMVIRCLSRTRFWAIRCVQKS